MRFEVHSHSEYSNIRLTDSISKLKNLISYAKDIGLAGIAITDHESLGGHVKALKYAKKYDIKVALGNEIYLVDERVNGQKYYHFILIAKDEIGYEQLSKLSSRAWMLGYKDRSADYRVPTLKKDIEEIVGNNKGHLIATTACLGGELSTAASNLITAQKLGNQTGAKEAHSQIVKFMTWCKEMFGNDFYVECAPGCSPEQINVNQMLLSIAQAFNVKMVVGTDTHYLRKEDRYIHKAYLNSKKEEREVDAFYEYSYLQPEEDIIEHLKKSNYTEVFIEQMFNNSIEILNKIKDYSIFDMPHIPTVPVKEYPKATSIGLEKYPNLQLMHKSDNKYDRYWINESLDKLDELDKFNDIYLSELEEEARVKKVISEKLGTNMFQYPITLQHYIDLFWECGSTVGAGRGSACAALNHYLLGVTQLDPVKWNLPFFRYINDERVELGDIDIDLASSKRPYILQKIKEERGEWFNDSIDALSKANLGCTLIGTYGTESSKAAIQTACRGYRSEEYPDGIDVDEAKYLSSLIPVERGNAWSLKETYLGDKESGKKPVKIFVNEMNKYPGLIDIIFGIEGLIRSRGQHASGVILFDEDPYKNCSFMKSASGDITTQYDLHDCEERGLVKYDFLVTEVQDKITQCIHFLQEFGVIEKELTLREAYNKYLHPENVDLSDEEVWEAIKSGKVLNCFQFETDVGIQAIKKITPSNILELSDANGLMRLMTGGDGEEQPLDKYVRYKDDLSLWYEEMKMYGLTEEEMRIVEPYFKDSYGVPPSQEQLMKMLMDKDICGFTLGEANTARKIVGKKQVDKIPALRDKVLSQAKSPCLGNYIWKCGAGPQMGYSFSVIHALAYSCIGYQTGILASKVNPIYWNTSCLIVNSGSLEDNSKEEIVDIYEPELDEMKEGATYVDLPDRSGKIKKTASTDYAKTARAIGKIISNDIKISLIDINNSSFGFRPDPENNQILYGFKALPRVGDDVIEKIIKNRPYKSFKDFLNKCPLNKLAMIPLIKSGAFDLLEKEAAEKLGVDPRHWVMAYYIYRISEPKTKLNLQNFMTLLKHNLIPDKYKFEIETFNFNKYLKSFKKFKDWYIFDDGCYQFYSKFFDVNNLEVVEGFSAIKQKTWDKLYTLTMDTVRDWLKNNQVEVLNSLNSILFKETWDKYAEGSISAWEMESLCFYYHEHELSNVDYSKYGIEDFNLLQSNDIERYWKRNGREIPIYNLHVIAGTVIAKNDNKSSISLLTTTGVVNVKFTKEYYAMFNKQISKKNEEGKKKTIEKGWFNRGTKLLLTGFRREDTFVTKTYSNTPTHQIYLIEEIKDNGELVLRHERKGE